jgi:hypothetical protein
VYAAPGTINYPYSKVRNFMAFTQGTQLTPYYESRFQPAPEAPLFTEIKRDSAQLLRMILKYEKAAVEYSQDQAHYPSHKHHKECNIGRLEVLNESAARVKIDCKKFAEHWLGDSIRPRMQAILRQGKAPPCICIFHITYTKESQVYIDRKREKFEAEGFRVRVI